MGKEHKEIKEAKRKNKGIMGEDVKEDKESKEARRKNEANAEIMERKRKGGKGRQGK